MILNFRLVFIWCFLSLNKNITVMKVGQMFCNIQVFEHRCSVCAARIYIYIYIACRSSEISLDLIIIIVFLQTYSYFCYILTSFFYIVVLTFQTFIYIYIYIYISRIYLSNQCLSALKFMSSIPVRSEVYSIQQYVIDIVSHLQQVGGFLRVLQFHKTNKTDGLDLVIQLKHNV